MSSEAAAVLALLGTSRVGYKTVNMCTAIAQGLGRLVSELVTLPKAELLDVLGVGQQEASGAFSSCGTPELERAAKAIEHIAHAGASMLLTTDSDYPERLRESLGHVTPPLLTVAGAQELLLEPMMAVVGAREATPTGLTLAGDCGRWCASQGIAVVSGGARGVDLIAHEAVLNAGGRTVVILPEGLLVYRGSRTIMEAVEEGRATLVSEFWPKAKWATHAAVTRNATICGLASMVCVIDPRKTGGSVRTARLGLEQGKAVAVFDGSTEGRTGRRLQQSGASDLAPNGVLDAQHLEQLWASCNTPSARQGDLW